MSSTQLSFSLSTKANFDAVHLVGSWDSYKQRLPLSQKKAGSWKGTFKFPCSAVKPGSRYWYYYVINNIKVTHDPSEKSVVEPSTQRTLNVLDVPRNAAAPVVSYGARSSNKRASMEIPKGRGVSPSKIISPKPSRPYESRKVREADYSRSPQPNEDLCAKLDEMSLRKYRDVSPPSSVGSSLSSRGSGFSSPSSLSSLSDPPSSTSSSCTCNKYGVTRRGDRVKLDCGGRVCGYSDDSSSNCSSIEESSESEESEEEVVQKPRYKEIKPRGRVSASSSRSGGRVSTSDRRRR